MTKLLEKLRGEFDHIIVDTSPVFAADDVATLAPRPDGTLFVVRSKVSRSGAVSEALDLLQSVAGEDSGSSGERVNAASKSYYYYKHSEYYHPQKPGTTKVQEGAGHI